MKKQKILILGGGFGGVKAALELVNNEHFTVSLISNHPDFRFYPQLYHAATGGQQEAASIPLSEIFKNKNVQIINDSVERLDRQAKTVTGHGGQAYAYDVLIIALGSVTNYFDIQGLREYAYGVKTLDDATRLRDHLRQEPDGNIIIIGGGPTGVELAGALPAFLKHLAKNSNRQQVQSHIDLVEGEAILVPNLPRRFSDSITKRLQKLGVQLYLKQKVEAETADGLMVSGHQIASHSVVWTAGVTTNPFIKANNFQLGEHGKVKVDQYLQAEPRIFVIGDNAATAYSGLAQTAIRDGLFVAENLIRAAKKRPLKTYQAKRPIYVIPVGHGWAAVQWGRWHFSGRLGWWLRALADFIAYHDLEPWWPATREWHAAMSEAKD